MKKAPLKGASINFDLGNDEGLYMQASSDSNGKLVTFADSDDDSESIELE
jgi:hypothetical protein